MTNYIIVLLLMYSEIFFCIIIQPKGPTHKKLAIACVEDIFKHHILTKNDLGQNRVLLLTFMVTNNMLPPAHEIQEVVVQNLHHHQQFSMETIDQGQKIFHSYKECVNCPRPNKKIKRIYRRNFVENYQAFLVVMVVDTEENFDEKLSILTSLSTFNPRSNFFVYFASDVYNFPLVAFRILCKLWKHLIMNALVLIPRNLKVFELYRLNIENDGPDYCGSNPTLTKMDRCENGKMLQTRRHYFDYTLRKNHKNCTINVVSMPYVPFVINASAGIEIQILQDIGQQFNIFFNINLMEKTTDWGEKHNNQWTSGLGIIYNHSYIGIGNINPNAIYMDDFEFTYEHFSERMVWVVPIAQFVPKWRVLTAIFTFRVWSICIGSVILFAIFFYCSSKTGREFSNYKIFKNGVFTSFGILIMIPAKAPKTELTRVFFISLAIFSIIIGSVYTSSLMYFLKNPIREPQIGSTEDILASGLGIGGLSIDQEMFNVSAGDEKDSQTMEIFQKYQVLAEQENDTVFYWLQRVAQRDTCIVSSEFYVNYLMSQNNNITNDAEGKPRIFVIKKMLMEYSLTIVMKKGFPLLDEINKNIRYMVGSGLVNKMADKYIEAIKKQQFLVAYQENTARPLTVDHLQGAFAIVLIGYVLGIVSLILELVVKKIKNTRAKNKKIKNVRIVERAKVDSKVKIVRIQGRAKVDSKVKNFRHTHLIKAALER